MKSKKEQTFGEQAPDSRPRPGGEAAAGAEQEAHDRQVFKAFEEASLAVAEVLVRRLEEASRPEANEVYFHAAVDEELEALSRHTKQLQAIIGQLQDLKKLYDRRRKDLRGLRDWVRSHGKNGRGR